MKLSVVTAELESSVTYWKSMSNIIMAIFEWRISKRRKQKYTLSKHFNFLLFFTVFTWNKNVQWNVQTNFYDRLYASKLLHLHYVFNFWQSKTETKTVSAGKQSVHSPFCFSVLGKTKGLRGISDWQTFNIMSDFVKFSHGSRPLDLKYRMMPLPFLNSDRYVVSKFEWLS